MSNTFIVLKTVHNDMIRVNANAILCYTPVGIFTRLELSSGYTNEIQHTVEEIDKMLTEVFFMVKNNYVD